MRSLFRLLAELEDERAWKASFEATTNEQWDRLAAMVRQEITAGEIAPLDDVFPSRRLQIDLEPCVH